ncbi:Uncharacterised protein [Legionella bozemanae]|nr:Uncharacterised protein [Legionella bozemanae]
MVGNRDANKTRFSTELPLDLSDRQPKRVTGNIRNLCATSNSKKYYVC